LHRTRLLSDTLPKVKSAFFEHVVEKNQVVSELRASASAHPQFSKALLALIEGLKDDSLALRSHLTLALGLTSIPFAKLHLRNLIRDNQATQGVWNGIFLLSKLPQVWNTFRIALQNLPQLRFLSVICLDPPQIPKIPVCEAQSLKKTLRRCGLSPDVAAIRTNINQYLTMEGAHVLR
jgi:hypothetical protein